MWQSRSHHPSPKPNENSHLKRWLINLKYNINFKRGAMVPLPPPLIHPCLRHKMHADQDYIDTGSNIQVVFNSLNITAFVCSLKTIKEFLPSMLQHNHGHIVSIASIAGCTGLPGAVDYCSSKFAAVGLMEALRQELVSQRRTGIQFTTVCPSLITTGMFEGVKFR